MDIITSLHLNKIKQATGWFLFGCCILGILGNFYIESSVINYILLSITGALSVASLVIKPNYKIAYLLQIGIFLTVGCITFFFGDNTSYIGDMILLVGILLLYIYRFIRNYSYLAIAPLILVIAFLKWLPNQKNTIDFIANIVSSSLVLFMWTLFKHDLSQYIRESQKNEALARIGLNAGNFLHNLHLATAIKLIKRAQEYCEEGDLTGVKRFLLLLERWSREKKQLRENIVTAVKNNRTTEIESINVHTTINSVLETLLIDENVQQTVIVHKNFYNSDLVIEAIPFELHFILQNVLINAIEAMMDNGDPANRNLSINTLIKRKYIIITISDTGPGFSLTKKNRVILKSTKKGGGGYGIRYITALMNNYKGNVVFENNAGIGARVTLKFPNNGDSKIKISFKKQIGENND